MCAADGELALHRDQLAAWIATLREPVGIDPARLVVVGVCEDFLEELARHPMILARW